MPRARACAGLTAADDFGAFEWTCSGATDPVTFYSTQLAVGKGLRDLVTADAWLPNKVTVSNGGQPVFVTPSSVWWSNPVMPLPANPGATAGPLLLTGAGTIYTQTGDATTSGYDLYGSASDGIAIVTLGSATLAYSGLAALWCTSPAGNIGTTSDAALVCAGSVTNLWIEARLAGANRMIGTGVFFGDGVDQSRIHDTAIGGNADIQMGITLTTTNHDESSTANLIDHTAVSDTTANGFDTEEYSAADTIMFSTAVHNGSDGFYLGAHPRDTGSGSRKVLYGDLAADNGGAGANSNPNDEHYTVVQQISVNNAGSGVTMAGNYANYVALTDAQNGSNQLGFPAAGNPVDDTFTNVALIAAGDATTMPLSSIRQRSDHHRRPRHALLDRHRCDRDRADVQRRRPRRRELDGLRESRQQQRFQRVV